jgi:hypothetical protein
MFADERFNFGDDDTGTLGFVNVTPTDTGADVIRLVYDDGSPVLRDSAREPLTIDVPADPVATELDVHSTTGGQVVATLEEDVDPTEIPYAQVSLRDNGTVQTTAMTNASGVVTLSVPATAGTNLSLSAAPAGYATTSTDISVGDDDSSESSVTLPGQPAPAANLDGDAKLEDVNGDGSGDIFDVLTYYNNRDSDAVQNNPTQFDFDGDGSAGTLFDALALYNEFQ